MLRKIKLGGMSDCHQLCGNNACFHFVIISWRSLIQPLTRMVPSFGFDLYIKNYMFCSINFTHESSWAVLKIPPFTFGLNPCYKYVFDLRNISHALHCYEHKTNLIQTLKNPLDNKFWKIKQIITSFCTKNSWQSWPKIATEG